MAAIVPFPDPDANHLRRQELAAFLRSRRERIAPELVGLLPSRRRRTPGLRREEVAQLAGVGVTWYTWLEQGRDINPSAQVLDAIARTLHFDMNERAHLFTLAGATDASVPPEEDALPPGAHALLERLEPYPALIINARYDMLAYNRIWASGFPHVDAIPREDRNCLWLLFTDPHWRKVLPDWEDASSRMVAQYRSAMAEHVNEPCWKNLVARLQQASPDFVRVWARHDVQVPETYIKRFRHPEVGLLRLQYTSLWFGQRIGTRLSTYTPADEQTRERLERLRRARAARPA